MTTLSTNELQQRDEEINKLQDKLTASLNQEKELLAQVQQLQQQVYI